MRNKRKFIKRKRKVRERKLYKMEKKGLKIISSISSCNIEISKYYMKKLSMLYSNIAISASILICRLRIKVDGNGCVTKSDTKT